ncbi:MAG TPA: site-2 protease family protein [Actinomycetes bacterium]|jgi:Zn-dependent protease|nr:site-2 protease family protein [Actinomycetes bacterium]
MTASLRLGRIAGIPIGASWSVLLIVLLIAWPLAGTLLPDQAPGLAAATYWLAGAVGAGLFLASLLAHELGHALVARRAGLRVRGITLWLLGGVAQLEDEPASPHDELRVALVGPAVSLALAVGFGLAAVALDMVGSLTVAVVVAAWLALGNTALALFNLVPAAPLDGGRVLRGLLWRRHGDRVRASLTATRAGRLVGAVLIVYGLLGTLTGWGIGTLWTVLVGWFLTTAARQERDQAVLRHDLGGLRAGDVMTPAPVTAPAWFTVDAFLRTHLQPWGVTALPLRTFEGQPAGVVTVAALESVPPHRRHIVRAGDVAIPMSALLVVAPDRPVTDLLGRLAGSGGVAAVVANGELLGLVTPAELARATSLAGGRARAVA